MKVVRTIRVGRFTFVGPFESDVVYIKARHIDSYLDWVEIVGIRGDFLSDDAIGK